VCTIANDPDPQRALRVGYVSADFRRHSVAYFLRGLVASHDRRRVRVYCYSNVERADTVTAEFQSLADEWRPVTGLPDAAVAEQVRADRIDILVDLGGHTGGNRLLVFARKPAPVQVTWLGYPNTTGLPAIDYRLTDDIADPPGEADALHTEKLVRLPGGFLCYRPGAEAAGTPAAPRDASAGPVTFGSFNTLSKVTAEVIRVWSAILGRIPGSRLLLKSEGLDEQGTRARVSGAFAAHGIAPDRIGLLPWIEGYGEHMALYSRVDVALDPFPYNGTTTTCEALWMGVPVIALRGNRHAARVGASVLYHAGLPQWIAEDEAGYIALAVAGAADPQALRASRPANAERARASALTDQVRFTHDLEGAYRGMWVAYCGSTVR
jgi:protein O-GlcNAc transferase